MVHLTDRLNRKIDYLRISVTDRCNLRCSYCVPHDNIPLKSHAEILRYEEIQQLVKYAVNWGITKIRITGGEPLIKPQITQLIEKLAIIDGIEDIALTTNGVLLTKYAAELKSAGLNRINVSLDTLDTLRFEKITGVDLLTQVLQGIDAAYRAELFPLKINVVLIKGFNDDELINFVNLTKARELHVRFIEFMPTGIRNWSIDKVFTCAEAKNELDKYYQLIPIIPTELIGNGPAKNYQLNGHKGTIGFIPALSDCFCASCNRIRLTADGYLKPCLHSDAEIDIKSELRAGADEQRIRSLFEQAINLKPGQYHLPQLSKRLGNRPMVQIGG